MGNAPQTPSPGWGERNFRKLIFYRPIRGLNFYNANPRFYRRLLSTAPPMLRHACKSSSHLLKRKTLQVFRFGNHRDDRMVGALRVGRLKNLSFIHRCAYAATVKAMQIEYPESWTASAGSSSERFENEARMALAMKLFEMGAADQRSGGATGRSFAHGFSLQLSAMERARRELGRRRAGR
jgi:hypothetical protein